MVCSKKLAFSITGNADGTATALTSKNIGGASTPVYFNENGVPVACTSLNLNTTGSAAKLTTDAGSNVLPVYFSNGETPVFYGDDKVLASVNTYDFNIYTKGNYLNILNELKKILSDNGWNWVEDGEDIYEDDTHFFHKVTTWSKERNDFKWLK